MPLLVHFPASQRALFKPDGETAYWQSSAAALFLEFSNFFLKKDLLLKDYIAELVYSKFLTTPTREMRQTQSLGWAIPPLIGLQGRRVWSVWMGLPRGLVYSLSPWNYLVLTLVIASMSHLALCGDPLSRHPKQ